MVVAPHLGLRYYVSVAGVTGVKEADASAVAPHVERVRKASGLPVAVGFGIKTPERAAAIARVADAVVVGSALVDEVADALGGERRRDRAGSFQSGIRLLRLCAFARVGARSLENHGDG